MATITSTIKLVDQMTPTLKKIARAIDNVNSSAKNISKAVEASNARIIRSGEEVTRRTKARSEFEKQIAREQAAFERRERADYINWWKQTLAEQEAAEKQKVAAEKALAREQAAAEKAAARETLAAERTAKAEEKRIARETAAEAKRLAREQAAEEKRLAAERAAYLKTIPGQWSRITEAIRKARQGTISWRDAITTSASASGSLMSMFASKVANVRSQFTRTTSAANKLWSVVRRLVMLFGAYVGMRGMVEVADTMMNATARIDNINDGLRSTSQYLDTIYGAAQRSRGDFLTMVSAVGKLGTLAGHAFSGDINQIIAFTELLNKMFVISGSTAGEAAMSVHQLTQAMASGRLQGDEMKTILESSGMLAQILADYLGVSKGEIKELGAQGVITADVIRAALFESADDIEKRFENMPKTIGQIWTQIKNHALNAFRPVIDRVQKFINSPMFQKFQNKIYDIITGIANKVIRFFDLLETPRVQAALHAIVNAFKVLWSVATWVGSKIVSVIKWIADHWEALEPIIYTVVAVLLVTAIQNLWECIKLLFIKSALWIANGIASFVSALMAGEAWAWVILIIGAVIAIIYLAVAAWNHFTGQTVSATGVILGSIAFVVSGIIWVFQIIWDVFQALASIICQVAELIVAWFQYTHANSKIIWLSIAIAFVDAINSMIEGAGNGVKEMLKPFVSLANWCIDLFNSIAEAWNNSLGSWNARVTNPFTGAEYDIGFGKIDTVDKITTDGVLDVGSTISNHLKLQLAGAVATKTAAQSRLDAGFNWGIVGGYFTDNVNPFEAFDTWYQRGESFENGVSDIIGGIGALISGLFGGSDTDPKLLDKFSGGNKHFVPKSTEALLDGYGAPNDLLGAIADNTGAGAGSAANIDDTLDMAEDELELLRKIAEKEVVNRFTTAEIKVNMTNNNNVNSKMDLDGIVTHLSTKLYEELGVVASGVHY